MSDELVKIDFSKWPPHNLYMPKCDKCGKTSGLLLYGVCGDCIHLLIQADRAKTPPSMAADRTREEG